MRDAELEALRAKVDCRTLLEAAGWHYEPRASTQFAAKYRGGPGLIVIVTHDGRGWFDPLADRRGDVIALAQYLCGGTLGHARQALRRLAGRAPEMPRASRGEGAPALNAPALWASAARPVPGSPVWRYLTEQRGLPVTALQVALNADVLREGRRGTAWALHRGPGGDVSGWEMRGPQYKGFARGGCKGLFSLSDPRQARRLVVTESAIDAISLAVLESWPAGSAYVSTGGGFGPATLRTLEAFRPQSGRLVAATDRGTGGELLADRLMAFAEQSGLGFGRLRPVAKDWNEQLCASGSGAGACTVQAEAP